MSSGGGGGGGANTEAEERRKAQLRAKINAYYGIKSEYPTTPKKYSISTDPENGGLQRVEIKDPLADQENADAASLAGQADAAAAQMGQEKTQLGDATRQYYADQLARAYQKAERGTRFRLARQGLLGGSEDANQQGEVRSDRDLGATRVDDAVRRAMSALSTQREQERLNAINLVNAGAGDSAISAAQAGLRNSLENVSSQQKADLFSDLFSSGANALANQNLAAQQAALAARYRDRLSTFFPAGSTTSGRITAS